MSPDEAEVDMKDKWEVDPKKVMKVNFIPKEEDSRSVNLDKGDYEQKRCESC